MNEYTHFHNMSVLTFLRVASAPISDRSACTSSCLTSEVNLFSCKQHTAHGLHYLLCALLNERMLPW